MVLWPLHKKQTLVVFLHLIDQITLHTDTCIYTVLLNHDTDLTAVTSAPKIMSLCKLPAELTAGTKN